MEITPQKSWLIKQLVYPMVGNYLNTFFSKNNIPYMPIKGAFLLFSSIAQHIEKRPTGDIDILIPIDRFNQAVEKFSQQCNVQLNQQVYKHFHTSFVYQYQHTALTIEFHKTFNDPYKYSMPTEQLFQRGKHLHTTLWYPCLEDALCMSLCHSLSHCAFGINYSVIYDIRALIRQAAFSWSTFWKIAESTHVMPWISFMLTLYTKETGDTNFFIPSYAFEKYLAKKYSIAQLNAQTILWRRLFLESLHVQKPVHMYFHRLVRNILKSF